MHGVYIFFAQFEPEQAINARKLKATLRTLSSAMSISHSMMHVTNGKVVYLFKITDQMNSKLDILSQDLKHLYWLAETTQKICEFSQMPQGIDVGTSF